MAQFEGDQLAAWLRQRAGKLTASRMGDAMDFLKNGNPSKARLDYMIELVAERVGGGDSVQHFVSDAMRWGLEQENDAKLTYQSETGAFIRESTFFDHPRIDNFGATPDGELNGMGLIEIKCPTTPKFVRWVMAGVVPDEHKPQMLAQLACTGRKWCEFVAYDPRVRQRPLFVRRFEPTQGEIEAVEACAVKFLDEVDAMFYAFTTAAA